MQRFYSDNLFLLNCSNFFLFPFTEKNPLDLKKNLATGSVLLSVRHKCYDQTDLVRN